MIRKNTLKFLKELKLNNTREWMDRNRESYESVKEDILKATAELNTSFWDIDQGIAHAGLDPKGCITRLNRDLRFAKDKTPYKTDYYIVFNKNGKNSPSAFYYVHVEPGNCFMGGGVYNPQPPELKKIRHKIDDALDEWTALLGDESFQRTFPTGIHHSGELKKIPREFDQANPAGDFLRMKGFHTMEKLSDKEITSEDVHAKIIACFKAAKPLVDFLNRAIA